MLTEGFPARDVLAGMVHLVRQASHLGPAPIFHWGDIGVLAAWLTNKDALGLEQEELDPEPPLLG